MYSTHWDDKNFIGFHKRQACQIGVTPTPALKSESYQSCVLVTIRYIYIITIAYFSNYNDEIFSIMSFIACMWKVKQYLLSNTQLSGMDCEYRNMVYLFEIMNK